MNVKDVIRENRLALGLTMKEVADKVGVSEATISRWESGEIANMRRGAIFPVKLFNELSKEDYPMLKKFALATIATMALSIATPALASDYLANTKSGKFHFADCRTIKHPDAPHFVPYDSRDEAIADGCKPCGVCEP